MECAEQLQLIQTLVFEAEVDTFTALDHLEVSSSMLFYKVFHLFVLNEIEIYVFQ